MMAKPTMYFKAGTNYATTHLLPNCDEASTLLLLMKKSFVVPADLSLIAKLGFDIVIGGELRPFKKDAEAIGIDKELKGILKYE